MTRSVEDELLALEQEGRWSHRHPFAAMTAVIVVVLAIMATSVAVLYVGIRAGVELGEALWNLLAEV